MAIKLTKKISREMLSSAATNGKDRGKTVIVELLPGDEIGFRIKGSRTLYKVYLGHCFRLAQIQSTEQQFRDAMERYRNRGTKRMRKPKRTALPFGNIYFKALNKD